MGDPGLLLLDEPTAGLDLVGREQLVATLASVASDIETPATVLVTHHTDEIPPGFTHGLLLRNGRVMACGPIDQVLTADSLSECFGLRLELENRDGRWLSWATANFHERSSSQDNSQSFGEVAEIYHRVGGLSRVIRLDP